MRALVLAVLAAQALCIAQTPIDPLVRPEETPGDLRWQVGLGYTPRGASGMAWDDGVPYSFTRLAHGFHLSLGGSVSLAPELSAGLELFDTTFRVYEKRDYPFGTVEVRETTREFGYEAHARWRLDPANPWDPRITLSLGRPWATGLEVQLSFLQDPVVLGLQFGAKTSADDGSTWGSAALGAVFVASRQITLGASASLSVPVGQAGAPAASLGLRVRYALDLEARREVEARANLGLSGEAVWLGLHLVLEGRAS